MIWQGKNCSSKEQLREIQQYINNRLSERYDVIDVVDDRICFALKTGEILSVTCMFGDSVCALCTEYAESEQAMKQYSTTDGDLYPLEVFEEPEEMLKAMLKEIED